MACSPAEVDGDGGYATAAFAGVALAVTLTSTALVAASAAELRSARKDFEAARRRLALEGSLVEGEFRLLHLSASSTTSWTVPSSIGPTLVTAQAEAGKIGLSKASGLPGRRAIAALVSNDEADRVAGVLRKAADEDFSLARDRVLGAAQTPAWRACALSVFSWFSQAEAARMDAPQSVSTDLNWRIGEVWRLTAQAQAPDGTGLDVYIRFIGDPGQPVAVIGRWEGASVEGTDDCASRLAATEPHH